MIWVLLAGIIIGSIVSTLVVLSLSAISARCDERDCEDYQKGHYVD